MFALVDLDPQMVEPRLEGEEELRQVPLLDEEHSTCIGTTIVAAETELIHKALKKNVDLFAWTTSDMLGVSSDIITHKLSVNKEARPVAQKKCKLGKEKRLEVKEEAEKLLSVGFIRESRYTTWLVNVVMVTKANGKWKMCMG